MYYNIFEIIRTGKTYKNGRGQTVERATSEHRATVQGRNGGEALKKFIYTLPTNKRGEVFKMARVWIGTNEKGRTTYTAQKV